MQLQAGYILDGLLEQFNEDSIQKEQAWKLAHWLSFFELNSHNLEQNINATNNSLLNVLINLLQRGTPTRLNVKALDFIVSNSRLVEYSNDDEFVIGLKFTKKIIEQVWKSLHIIDPRLSGNEIQNNYKNNGTELGSEYEEKFLFNTFERAFGKYGDVFIQLLTAQRSLKSILKNNIPKNIPQHTRQSFEEQRTDFSIEFPYSQPNNPNGIVIEVDGMQHRGDQQLYLDRQRDEVLTKIRWHNTIRIPTENIRNGVHLSTIKTTFKNAVDNTFIKTTESNYAKSLLSDKIGLEVLQLVLCPYGIARFQRTILELISRNILSIKASKWKIAIIERDVPCAAIAINDIVETLGKFSILSPNSFTLPEIDVQIFTTKEFVNSQFQLADNTKSTDQFNPKEKFSCVIDISVLQRKNTWSQVNSVSPVICIRSIDFMDIERKIATSKHLQFHPICEKTIDEQWKDDEEKKGALEYFLQSIFRKKSFRRGQLPIINKALQAKSVIGLLPTGGGKSITYQLSALLQPGICMVIDPIRSLMKDQVDGLTDNYIDSAVFVNSTLKGEAKANAIKKIVRGQALFVFISPERLQMDEFRDLLGKMHEDKIYFSYCVIDEAHCVSEWGHDFRTAYLRLGINANRSCKTASNEPVPLFGLTATASYDVLADIQRELSGYGAYKLDEDSLIRFESTTRHEIQFIIEDVSIPGKFYEKPWKLKQDLGNSKKARINQVLNNLPNTFTRFLDMPRQFFPETMWEDQPEETQKKSDSMLIKDFVPGKFFSNENGGLIFCPHKSGPYGITDQFKPEKNGVPVSFDGILDHLKTRTGINPGFFMGSGDEQDETSQVIMEKSIENQDLFKKNKLNLMIATKAFGMGIDKPNIRYTIHMNYPGSIESYVQEAGRAGRDGDLAFSILLFNQQTFKVGSSQEDFDHDLDVNFYFHNNSFKGISKEMAVLDELLTEIYFPDRTSEIENLIHQELDIEIQCTYSEKESFKTLFIDQGFENKLGHINLINLTTNITKSFNPDLSNQILPLIINYINNLHLTMPAYEWIQQSDKQQGIEQIISRKREGERFKIELGFVNNHRERVKTLTQWLQKVIHPKFTEETVQKLRKESTNADGFIEKIVELNGVYVPGYTLDFEVRCKERDKVKGHPPGYAFEYFSNMFNGYRNKQDTERAIYRLTILGVIEDYTVNFNSNTFTLIGTKKNDKDYKFNVEKYLEKFYAEKAAKIRLKEIEKIDEPTFIRKCLYFIVKFVYESIKTKRALAIKEMREACIQTIEKGANGNLFLREYIDLYFNSKYARKGYYFSDKETGKDVQASLTDATKDGKFSSIKIVLDFINYIDRDKTGTQIENTKHLRGACIRMITNFPDNYTFRLLNTFTLFMLEYKNERLMMEAIDHLIVGFERMAELDGLEDSKLEKVFNEYKELVTMKNENLMESLKSLDIDFSFDSIMISRILKKLTGANSSLKKLNDKLNKSIA